MTSGETETAGIVGIKPKNTAAETSEEISAGLSWSSSTNQTLTSLRTAGMLRNAAQHQWEKAGGYQVLWPVFTFSCSPRPLQHSAVSLSHPVPHPLLSLPTVLFYPAILSLFHSLFFFPLIFIFKSSNSLFASLKRRPVGTFGSRSLLTPVFLSPLSAGRFCSFSFWLSNAGRRNTLSVWG